MKNRWSNVLKVCAIVLALSLFAGSVFFTGADSSRATAATGSAATTTVAQADVSADEPQVDSMSATPLKEPTAEGNALLMVQFSPDQKIEPQVKTVIDDRGVLLRDDGTEGDEVAGDGTHSAVIFLDFEELANNQDEIQSINAQPEPEPTPEETELGPAQPPSADGRTTGSASATQAEADADQQTATAAVATEEERADTNLASDSAVVMPDFDETRDMIGNKAEPLVDFRNVQPGQIVPLRRIGTYRRVNPQKSLVITNLKVVENWDRTFNPCTGAGTPMGRWTFGYLMTQMANQPVTGINPSTFTRQWLNKWMNNQNINGWTVAQRQKIKTLVIDPWVAASGGPTMPLNLSIAPFKLLAIVNRIDLRGNTTYGGGNAGEGRFVFGLIDRTGTGHNDPSYTSTGSRNCRETQFTVIFEYGIDRHGCNAVRDWGRQWYNLRNFVLGSPAYNNALQAITDQFTAAGVAPRKPNGSALNQLRTNEVELLLGVSMNPVWELREFKIGGEPAVNPGMLEEVTVKMTPDLSLNQSVRMTDYVNQNTPAILNQTNVVPEIFQTLPFLGGSSLAPRNPAAAVDVNTHWNNAPGGPFIFNRQARHEFSLDTCNSCHTGETNTVFTHIKPAPFGTEAKLSGFMNGITPVTLVQPFKVVDPADGAPTRKFNEFRRRRIDLDILVHTPCFFDFGRRFRALVH